jgi:hypothetical protein
MFWLNVDKPNNFYKLHNESCVYAVPNETEYKGIEEMRRDGGWFKFDTYDEAFRYYRKTRPNAIWQLYKVCNPEK